MNLRFTTKFWASVAFLGLLTVGITLPVRASGQAESSGPARIFFDDFTYSGQDDTLLKNSGWLLRDGDGGPGVAGCSWSKNNITFIDDTTTPGNRLVRLTSSTDGTGKNTSQTELYTKGKFFEGTYATRVKFADAPITGPNGDNVVETFFTITLGKEGNPNYCENDFEYLPNGGWGGPGPIMYETTWENVIPEPWFGDRVNVNQPVSYVGWHTLVAVVKDGFVNYFVDGKQVAHHGDKFYPEIPMSINFNLWFIDGGTLKSTEKRVYQQDIDWIYFAEDKQLTPEQVTAEIEKYRGQKVARIDDVQEKTGAVPANPELLLASTPKKGKYELKVTVPATSTATSMRILEDDKLIKYQKLDPAAPKAQEVVLDFEKTPRDYRYAVELSNINGTSYSKELLVSVAPPEGEPVNVAFGKKVSGSYMAGTGREMVDGDKDSNKFTGNGDGARWLQIDLGQSYDINQINMWHYFADARIYHDVIVQISNTEDFSSGVTTVFNNDTDNSAGQGAGKDAEYPESDKGKAVTFATKNVRYVRLWTNGSSGNAWNHFVEVEVWTAPKTK